MDEQGTIIENGASCKKNTKLKLNLTIKNYDWQVQCWELNGSEMPNTANKKSITHIVQSNIKIKVKMNKIVYDKTKANITFNIANEDELDGRDNVNLTLQLLGEKKEIEYKLIGGMERKKIIFFNQTM